MQARPHMCLHVSSFRNALRRYIEESSLRVLQAEDGKGRRMQLFTGATKHVAAVVVHRN